MKKLKEDANSVVDQFKYQARLVAKNTVEEFFDNVAAQCNEDAGDDILEACGHIAVYFLKGVREELEQYFPIDMFMPDFDKAVKDLMATEGCLVESKKPRMREGTFPRNRADTITPITRAEEAILGTKEYNALLDAVKKLGLSPDNFARDGSGVKNKLKSSLYYYTKAGQYPKKASDFNLVRRWIGDIKVKNHELRMEVAVQTYKVEDVPVYKALVGLYQWEGAVLTPSAIKILESVGFEKAIADVPVANGNPDYISAYGSTAFSTVDDAYEEAPFNDYAPINAMVMEDSITTVALKLRKLIAKLELVNKSFEANDASNETEYYTKQGLIADPNNEWTETFLYDEAAGDEIVRVSSKASSKEKSKLAETLLLYLGEIQEEVYEEDPDEVDNVNWGKLEHWVDNYGPDYLYAKDFLQEFVDKFKAELANAPHYDMHDIWVGTEDHVVNINDNRKKKLAKMKANKERDDLHRYEAARRQILKRVKESTTKNVSKNKR